MPEWWKTDRYTMADRIGEFEVLAGPMGPALVRVWPDGRTDPGWGGEQFMDRYLKGEFMDRRILFGYERGKWAFAFVMRSVQMVCIDIDGKNGGLEHAKRLGMLPPTMAETSKSGDGYHLFYATDEQWDDKAGYAMLNDRIGLEQGVDFRGVGCVYHHDTQRWNDRPPALLPDHLRTLLQHKEQRASATSARIVKVLGTQDELEILMLQDEIERDLAKPIPHGKRNTTLFAIGSQMCQAGIEDWEAKVEHRGRDAGLDMGEINKIIANIDRYSGTKAP